MADGIARRIGFLREADRLKSVARANVLMDLSRPENSAEHSWHVALWALVFGASDRAVAMLLIHDLVEIDVGDHPIHLDHDAATLARQEAAAARRIFGLLPGGGALLSLWQEFEAAGSADAVQAKRMDHVQPLFQVLMASDPLPDHVRIVRDNLSTGRAARLHREWAPAVRAAETLLAGGVPQGDLGARLRFLAKADRLKSVQRASTLIDGSRRENSAEHSWHLALSALAFADRAGPGVDIGRVIRMLLIHDLVEIDMGDVSQYLAGGTAQGSAGVCAARGVAAERIFGLLPPAQGAALLALWQEVESGRTPDADFARALERCQPAIRTLPPGAPAIGDWLDRRAGAVFSDGASQSDGAGERSRT